MHDEVRSLHAVEHGVDTPQPQHRENEKAEQESQQCDNAHAVRRGGHLHRDPVRARWKSHSLCPYLIRDVNKTIEGKEERLIC